MAQQQCNKPRPVRKMRPTDWEDHQARLDADRARRASHRARKTSQLSEQALLDIETAFPSSRGMS